VRSCSLDRAVFTSAASVFANHTYFLATQTSVLDRHTEELVFALLVVGSERVLV
jgi:hypothetical protein